MKTTWEKIFEYASMPVHGTMSRKLRKGLALQINDGKIYESAVIFMGEFVRISEDAADGKMINTYYDWDGIKGTLKNGLFAQTLRYAQNFILGISTICLR
jgi:hypothetical protein